MSAADRKFNRDDRGQSAYSTAHDTDIEGAFYDGIGAELKAERIRCGLHLHEVAARLRIREAHLEAIEDGRFGDLPGRIYAIGFVRSYAEFLGADGDVCITLFKAEVGPGGHSRKLVFPVPESENRRPGLVTLTASVLLAAMVYGGWYVWQGDERQSAELVPEVPQRFVEQAEIARVREETAVAGLAAANASEAAAPIVSEDETAVDEQVTTLDLAVVGRRTEQAASGGGQTATADEEVSGKPADPVEPDDRALASDSAVEETAPGTTTGSADGSTGQAEATEPVQLAVVAPPPIPEAAPQETNVPRVYGISNRNARVLLRATGQVQIIVKRTDGTTLMPHRVLQAGDIYRAPNRGDVILQADNPGVLQLIVDGRLIGRGDRLVQAGKALSLNPETLGSLRN